MRKLIANLIHFVGIVLNAIAAVGLAWTITHGVSLWQ